MSAPASTAGASAIAVNAAAASAAAAASVSSGSKRVFPGAAADRRVQPRHFHAGPNPAAAAADSSHAESLAEPGPAPADRLYRHALESIFAFLGWRELATVLRVSKPWLCAVQSMRGLYFGASKPSALLWSIAASAMGRHITSLGMAQLRQLFGRLTPSPIDQRFVFPRALLRLALHVGAPTANRASVDVTANTAIRAIGQLQQLERLTLTLSVWDVELSFVPLSKAALPQLERFIIRVDGDGPFGLSDAQIEQLRAMPQLEMLSLPRRAMTKDLLRRLLRQPHDLRWQEVTLPEPLDDETAALLAQLPSLAILYGLGATCVRFDWLSRLVHLRRVTLAFPQAGPAGRAESLVAALHHCTQIESLHLACCDDLTAAHLAALLSRVPRLAELWLNSLRIDSLSFLAQEPAQRRLARLELHSCTRVPLAELVHVHALRGLRELTIFRSFDASLDQFSQRLLTPPSVLLPQLRSFDYTPPAAAAGQ